MKHRIFVCALVLCLLISLCPVVRAAEEGSCGTGITWAYDNGTLTISGSGAMEDMTGGAPWAAHKDSITSVVFTGGVTYVGAGAFKDYDSLRSVSFGSAMYELGAESFYSCDGLTALSMPASFKIFGVSCLQSCGSLTRIDCAGRFPKFQSNSLWQTSATIYYPADNPWSVDTINQLEGAFGGRINFLASDGSDPNPVPETTPPTEATTAPTEATTVPTEATTVPSQPSVQTLPAVTIPSRPQPTAPPNSAGQDPDNTTLWLVLLLIISVGASAAAVIIHSQQVKRRRRARRKRRPQ